MRFFTMILLVALAGLMPTRAAAQSEEIPEQIVLDIPHVQQEGDVWCWLAVSEMIVQHYQHGLSLPQCMMLDIIAETPAGTCCRNPDECRIYAHGLPPIQLLVARFADQPSVILPPMPPRVLYGALQTNHPVIAHVLGHVIMIRGMRFQPEIVETESGPVSLLAPYVYVNDPEHSVPIWLPYDIVRHNMVWMNSLVVGD